MAVRTVTRDELDETLKRITRMGTERIVRVEEIDDELCRVHTDRLTEPKLETR